jgi:hypothetical protein
MSKLTSCRFYYLDTDPVFTGQHVSRAVHYFVTLNWVQGLIHSIKRDSGSEAACLAGRQGITKK